MLLLSATPPTVDEVTSIFAPLLLPLPTTVEAEPGATSVCERSSCVCEGVQEESKEIAGISMPDCAAAAVVAGGGEEDADEDNDEVGKSDDDIGSGSGCAVFGRFFFFLFVDDLEVVVEVCEELCEDTVRDTMSCPGSPNCPAAVSSAIIANFLFFFAAAAAAVVVAAVTVVVLEVVVEEEVTEVEGVTEVVAVAVAVAKKE
jgi:hypothetical protein